MSSLIEIKVDDQKTFDGHVFPLVLAPNVDIKTMADILAVRYEICT
jgi:hypothetical protein